MGLLAAPPVGDPIAVATNLVDLLDELGIEPLVGLQDPVEAAVQEVVLAGVSVVLFVVTGFLRGRAATAGGKARGQVTADRSTASAPAGKRAGAGTAPSNTAIYSPPAVSPSGIESPATASSLTATRISSVPSIRVT